MSKTAQNTSIIATTNKVAKEHVANTFKTMMLVAPTDKHSVSDHIYRTAAVVIIFAVLLISVAALYVLVPIALAFSSLVRAGLDRFEHLFIADGAPTTVKQTSRVPAPAATRVLIAH